MLGLQLDTGTEFYRYYQHLALRALEGGDSPGAFSNANLRQYIEAWDGRAEPESRGLPLLAEFRAELVKAVLAPLLAKCRVLDPSFQYRWNNADVPVQQIIGSGRTDLLPGEGAFRDWNGFLLAVLVRSAHQLVQRLGAPSLAEIRWGDVSRVEVRHPLTQAVPFLGPLLNMADAPLPGCLFCVRSARAAHGATERMVVAPGHESKAILHMPGGQSGQPSSPHYSDQQQAWVEGRPIAFSVTPPLRRLTLMPKS
jgi:penicillin amidase